MNDLKIAQDEMSAPERDVYGLHAGVLGPVETLAQSVSAMAPSTSSSLTIPLVFALAGNGTWFVYLLATCSTLLVGFCVSQFARLSASPGSLYSYTADTLPPIFGVIAAWSLLLAYVATGASVAGGALYYAELLCRQFLGWSPPAVATLIVVCAFCGLIAWRDIRLSAELMLWIEAGSIGLILIVVAAMLTHFGIHIDVDQFRLTGVSLTALGPALVLSMFSFVGFESATTLGTEVKNPLHTIPRAVLQCAILAGVFFMLCSYAEVLGFRGGANLLGDSVSPLHLLAVRSGVASIGVAIDFGAGVSMLACVLACTTAAARVLMQMAHSGLLSPALKHTNARHGTPTAAIVLSTALMAAITVTMALRGIEGSTMYDWMGSLAVFGFLTAYALVAIALPIARRENSERSFVIAGTSTLTVVVLVSIAVYDLKSSADAAHAHIPYVYLAYLTMGIGWYWVRRQQLAEAEA